jgi:predicted transcriptional regulator
MCDEEYIMCFICDKRLKALASHLLHKHSISVSVCISRSKTKVFGR